MVLMQSTGAVPAFDLRISITGTEPEIWRRLQVPSALTVPQFHLAVQVAFGWEDRHLYGIRYMSGKGEPRTLTGPPDPETEDYEAEPASGVVLSDLLDPSKPQRSAFDYEYDFGDGWVHHVEVLGAIGLGPGDLVCTGGANRGPVEDSGGAGGYRRLVQILADKTHPEHGDASSWLCQLTGDFDSQFDASALTLTPQTASCGYSASSGGPGPSPRRNATPCCGRSGGCWNRRRPTACNSPRTAT